MCVPVFVCHGFIGFESREELTPNFGINIEGEY